MVAGDDDLNSAIEAIRTQQKMRHERRCVMASHLAGLGNIRDMSDAEIQGLARRETGSG